MTEPNFERLADLKEAAREVGLSLTYLPPSPTRTRALSGYRLFPWTEDADHGGLGCLYQCGSIGEAAAFVVGWRASRRQVAARMRQAGEMLVQAAGEIGSLGAPAR